MKVIFICAILTVLTALFLKINSNDWCILLICIGLVISLEMMNSAIEGIVDLIHPQQGEKAGRIKDISAGSVLVISIVALIIGGLIFGKYILHTLNLQF